jgi:hypothetical protein
MLSYEMALRGFALVLSFAEIDQFVSLISPNYWVLYCGDIK